MAGDESEEVTNKLALLKMNGITVAQRGLSSMNVKILRECMLVEERTLSDGSVKRTSAAVQKRLNCWLKVSSPQQPVLAQVAAVYLSMHRTSCASERNLSVFGRLYVKFRSRLQLKRGEKIVYLAVNDGIQNGTLDTSKDEVLFNDSGLEDESDVAEVDAGQVEGSPVNAMADMLAGVMPDDLEERPRNPHFL
jgi:hypothetical protein